MHSLLVGDAMGFWFMDGFCWAQESTVLMAHSRGLDDPSLKDRSEEMLVKR